MRPDPRGHRTLHRIAGAIATTLWRVADAIAWIGARLEDAGAAVGNQGHRVLEVACDYTEGRIARDLEDAMPCLCEFECWQHAPDCPAAGDKR